MPLSDFFDQKDAAEPSEGARAQDHGSTGLASQTATSEVEALEGTLLTGHLKGSWGPSKQPSDCLQSDRAGFPLSCSKCAFWIPGALGRFKAMAPEKEEIFQLQFYYLQVL